MHAQVLHRPVQLFPARGDGLLLLDCAYSPLKLVPGVVLEILGKLRLNLYFTVLTQITSNTNNGIRQHSVRNMQVFVPGIISNAIQVH